MTDGFDSYEWSTGDITNSIEIEDAVPGTEYSVTVTSVTGCSLVLIDTLPSQPEIDDLEFSFFEGSDTLELCFGDTYEYQPLGTNIGITEAIELGYSAETFNLFAAESQSIHFVTKDNFGCLYDTMQLIINVNEIKVEVDTYSTCIGASNGSLVISSLDQEILTASLDGGAYLETMQYDNLEAGKYNLALKNESGCMHEINAEILAIDLPVIDQLEITPATCGLENGALEVQCVSSDIEFSFDGSAFGTKNNWTNLESGIYKIYCANTNGCILEKEIEILGFLAPELFVDYTDTLFCDRTGNEIVCTSSHGVYPLSYSIDGQEYGAANIFSGISAGVYEVIVMDAYNCSDTLEISLFSMPSISIADVISIPSNCGLDNATLNVKVENDQLNFDFYLNEIIQDDMYVEDLQADVYKILVEDSNGCTDSYTESISQVSLPQINNIEYAKGECGEETAIIIIDASTYNGLISYGLNDNPLQSELEIELQYGENTIYIVDDLGCEVDTIVLLPEANQYSLANVFSPDEDGVNDFLCFQNIKNIDWIEYIYVFDRWGNRVYSIENRNSQNQNLCWDGKYNSQKVNSGVYVYQVRARLLDGRLLCKSGDVTVL